MVNHWTELKKTPLSFTVRSRAEGRGGRGGWVSMRKGREEGKKDGRRKESVSWWLSEEDKADRVIK